MPTGKVADDTQETPDLEAAKQELLAKAKKDSQIDQREIFSKIPDTPENADVLDALYTELADKSLQIVGANEPDSDEWGTEEEEIVLEEQAYLDDIADDSVRL